MNDTDNRIEGEIWRVNAGELVTNYNPKCLNTYEIALDRIQTHEDVVRWIIHLSRKTWGTPKMLRAFALAACAAKGWPSPEWLRD